MSSGVSSPLASRHDGLTRPLTIKSRPAWTILSHDVAWREHTDLAESGATVARQLSRAGQRVILLEMGRDYRRDVYYGSHLGPSSTAISVASCFRRKD